MADEGEPIEGEEGQEAAAAPNICLLWDGGDIVITDLAAFSQEYDTLAIRSHFKTGDLEILDADGCRWRRLGKADLKAVRDK